MVKRVKFIIAFSFFFLLVGFGIITVSNEVYSKSKVIWEAAPYKISLKTKPFDFRLETPNYIIYINDNSSKAIKEKANDVMNYLTGLRYRKLKDKLTQ